MFKDRGDRRLLVVKPHGNRAIAPGIVEHVASIRREYEFDAEAVGGVAEHARLVSGGRGEQEDAFHTSAR
jgi:hypothetical protein